MLGNLTADDFDNEANWSGCPEELEVRHYYRWHGSKKSSDQYAEIYSQEYWGLPEDTKLQSGVGPIQWFYIYTTGPVYSIYLDNQSYTNSSKLRCVYGYLPKPHKKITGITLDDVSFTPVEYSYNNKVVTPETTITIQWHTRTKRRLFGGYKTNRYSKEKTISCEYEDEDDTLLWPELNVSNQTISAVVTTHPTYSTLAINTPEHISDYHIRAESKNHTGYFIRSNYIYYPLAENCYYVERFDIINRSGINPFGRNIFILPADDYNISVKAGTPFEMSELNLNVTYVDAANNKPEPNKEYLTGLLTLFICALWLRHCNAPY